MRIETVRTFRGTAADAFQAAIAEKEPLFVPASVHLDDRGWSVMNQLQAVMGPDGQINYSLMFPGVVKAWHRHRRQTDFWLCLSGHLKAGIHRDDGRSWQTVIGEQRLGVLVIPPPLWHGAATVGAYSAGLFYYVTDAYDPQNPDEERRPYDSVEEFSWSLHHR